MIKVFVINLDKDILRMDFMDKQLKKLGIEYERMPGINGREFDFGDEYIERVAVAKNGAPLTPGEVGCAASHKRCYQNIITNNLLEALILEDDVLLPENFKDVLEKLILSNRDKRSWEYLSFDYLEPGFVYLKNWYKSLLFSYDKLIKYKSFFSKIKFTIVSFVKLCYLVPLSLFEQFRNSFYKHVKKSGAAVNFYRPLYFAGAYVVTNRGAGKLLQLTDPIVYPADRIQNQARVQLGLKFKAYAPLVVYQQRQEFGSSILGVKSIK